MQDVKDTKILPGAVSPEYTSSFFMGKRKNSASGAEHRKKKRTSVASDPEEDPATSIIGISRSISACKRCRQKKIKCSHDFPKCKGCLKAGVDCVSVDPITGREIPRSYVVHLETRLEQLENEIKRLSKDDKPEPQPHVGLPSQSELIDKIERVEKSTADSGSTAPSSYFGASSGISFSRLMYTALNFKDDEDDEDEDEDPDNNAKEEVLSHVSGDLPSDLHSHQTSVSSMSIVDPMMTYSVDDGNMAILPPKLQALQLLSLYFAQSNSQLPIFHRESFLRKYFVPLYGDVPENCNLATEYTAIGQVSDHHVDDEDTWYYQYTCKLDEAARDEDFDPLKFSAVVDVPRKFKKALFFMNLVFAIASSVIHLQYPEQISAEFKCSAMRYIDAVYIGGSRIERLQCILCLTIYSLMRPCVPGCWYLLGSALRLAEDLGLHADDTRKNADPFTVDLRRRLFWCCYSLDRQICFYLGRPFGIPEECCRAKYPSGLDDAFIREDDKVLVAGNSEPSYKRVCLAMFSIRKLQAEIQSILYNGRELPRRFNTLDDWYDDISARLDLWLNSVPATEEQMNCDFNTQFFHLNYNHTRIMLHGLSPAHYQLSLNNYMTLVEASTQMILCYERLYSCKLLNYTWAATHNLFVAGTCFLYSVFNCEQARQATPLQQVQKVVSYCNRILSSLVDRCDAAAHCKDVFEILTAAVIKLKYTDNIVHSVDLSKVPSHEEIALIQPGGHVPPNLRNLVTDLEKAKNGAAVTGNSPPASKPFKWSTKEDDLDRFFVQLENTESPTSTYELNVDQPPLSQPILPMQPPLSVPAMETTPEYEIITEAPASAPPQPSSSSRTVFKMMHQVPTEGIWDQFFATQYSE